MVRIVNTHTHIFTGKFAPDYFFKVALPKSLHNWADEIKAILESRRARWLIRWVSRKNGKSNMQRFINFMEMGLEESQGDVFRKLQDSYSTLGAGTRHIVLTLNMDHMGSGPSHHPPIEDQLREVELLRRDYPDTLLPFVCVDPRHKQGAALRDWVKPMIEQRRFFGIKMYPSLGFFPCDPRLTELYEWAAANGVPIMTHVTRVGVFYTGQLKEVLTTREAPCLHKDVAGSGYHSERDKISERLRKYLDDPFTAAKGQSKYAGNLFLNPRNFIPVLDRFKNLKICFAHFGGDDEIMRVKGPLNPTPLPPLEVTNHNIDSDNFYAEIKHLMEQYKNVYTDISYTLFKVVDPVYGPIKNAIDNTNSVDGSEIGKRVLFGTDYYMTLQEDTEPRLWQNCRTELEKNNTVNGVQVDRWQKIAVANANAYLATTFLPDPGNTTFTSS